MFENQYLKENIKIIFLIGFMGSGKSTLGKLLSECLNYNFFDSDQCIEKQQGLDINSIFSLHGEIYFRNLESHFLQNMQLEKSSVISSGGGFPCFNHNLKMMKEMGTVFYLKASPKEIFNRILHDESRPLLKNLSSEEKLAYIQNKLNERRVFYEQAHITIDADKPIENQLNAIKCHLS